MYLTTFDQGEQVDQRMVAVDAVSLYRTFEQVKDGRGSKGKRYPLAFLLTVLLLGKMAGETKMEEIIDWINERKGEIKKALNWPKGFPAANTYISAFAKCNHHEIAKVVAQVMVKARAEEQCGDERSRLFAPNGQSSDYLIHTAIDGKMMRGTLKHGRDDQPPVHLLSFYECENGIVLDQFVVDRKRNEESACKAILHPLLVKGRIISGDSIFSYRDWCAAVSAYKGYCVIPIKENNPAVLHYLREFFEDEGIDREEFQYYKEVNKGHGRLEMREIWASTQMNE